MTRPLLQVIRRLAYCEWRMFVLISTRWSLLQELIREKAQEERVQ